MTTNFEMTSKLTNFLMEQTGSIWGTWEGRMSAKAQRDLFGMFIGKGKIRINGEKETIEHVISVCFGLDYDVTFDRKFHQLTEGN